MASFPGEERPFLGAASCLVAVAFSSLEEASYQAGEVVSAFLGAEFPGLASVVSLVFLVLQRLCQVQRDQAVLITSYLELIERHDPLLELCQDPHVAHPRRLCDLTEKVALLHSW